MQGNVASWARVVFHQGKRKQKHAGAADRENPIGIDVRKCGGLRLESSIDSGQGLPLRFEEAETRVVKLLRQAIERSLELRISGRDVVGQSYLVELRPAGDDGRNHGGSHAGADVTREIYQTSDGVAL